MRRWAPVAAERATVPTTWQWSGSIELVQEKVELAFILDESVFAERAATSSLFAPLDSQSAYQSLRVAQATTSASIRTLKPNFTATRISVRVVR